MYNRALTSKHTASLLKHRMGRHGFDGTSRLCTLPTRYCRVRKLRYYLLTCQIVQGLKSFFEVVEFDAASFHATQNGS